MPVEQKSLLAIAAPFKNLPPYGRVNTFEHIDNPDDFNNCLYIDISRDMCDAQKIEQSIDRTIAHKHAFNAVTALYLMWESDQLTPALEKLVKAFDFVIVTTNILDENLAKMNIEVSHLLHPYDYANLIKFKQKEVTDYLVFGISCGLWPRKNVALLATIFADVFGNNPQYVLKIHTRFDPELDDFASEYSILSKLMDNFENIQLESISYNRDDYVSWMRSLDVYCFISSGEGYSITPREALHLGIPVILLDAHVHQEFSHLPGIIRVKTQGMKVSTPNHHEGDLDQGNDWKVDEQSLREAFHHVDKEHKKIRSCLIEKHFEIVDFHDVEQIKRTWVNELNRQYNNYLGSCTHYIPRILKVDKRKYQIDTRAIQLDMQSQMTDPLSNSNTGEKTNKGIFCFPSRHQAGHCVFGQNIYPIEEKMIQVRFFIDLLYNQFGDEPLINLDVYDNNNDLILVNQTFKIIDFINSPDSIILHCHANLEQRLEFRVFWYGHYDICVRNIEIVY